VVFGNLDIGKYGKYTLHMPDEKSIIHIRIRDLRRARSLTQEELAEALGLSRQSINAMEAGRCLPSLPVALQIASFFSVPLSAVFALNEEELQQAQEIISNSEHQEATMSTLTPWTPLREMREMLDDMMDTMVTPASTTGLPAANIAQTDTQVLVDLRLPGFKKEDLSIEVGENFLTIAGEVHHESEQGDKQYLRREFSEQSFSRTIGLPAQVQTTGAQAEMNHGVLHVVLNKVIEEKPKTAKIEIKSE